jgi:hypothetical protein
MFNQVKSCQQDAQLSIGRCLHLAPIERYFA